MGWAGGGGGVSLRNNCFKAYRQVRYQCVTHTYVCIAVSFHTTRNHYSLALLLDELVSSLALVVSSVRRGFTLGVKYIITSIFLRSSYACRLCKVAPSVRPGFRVAHARSTPTHKIQYIYPRTRNAGPRHVRKASLLLHLCTPLHTADVCSLANLLARSILF